MGKQLSIINDDGSRVMCYPTQGGIWYCGGSGSGPTPGDGSYDWPFNKNVITSGYGPRSGGVGTFHEGVDFSGGSAVLGASCKVTKDGTVTFSGTNSGFGNYVVVFHGTIPDWGDSYTVYGHLDSRSVSEGDVITQGTEVGKLGATGVITGPCLHWETHKCAIGGGIVWNTNDTSTPVRTAIDPLDFMAQFGTDTVLVP